MGCDGGTIPRRDELVRTKKKREEKDKKAELVGKWKYCAISSNKLVHPIVSCELGRLYNKDAIIEYLLNKEAPNSSLLAHIRNLKDIVTLNLTAKQGYKEKESSGDQETDEQDSKYVCPIVGQEMNGMYKFYYVRTCGCVVSERAVKEVKTDSCLVCNKPFSGEDDLIVLNGSDEEVEDLKKRMLERRNRTKEERKKKRKLDGEEKSCKSKELKTADKADSGSQVAASSNVKTSSMTVLQDKASKDYSVSKDPGASETYKSLFTTHESAKNRPKAHWVTFNPCYN